MSLDILNTQQKLLKIIFNNSKKKPKLNGLFQTVSGLSDDIIDVILGDFGRKLRTFAQVVDLEHPDLGKLLGDSAPVLDSAIRLSQHLAESDYLPLKAEFPKLLPSQIVKDLGTLDDPLRTQQFVRLLKSAEKREEFRRNKKAQSIQFGHMTKKGDMVWNNQPSSFDIYIPNSNAYVAECDKARDKAERYKKLGCDSLYQEMVKGITEYEKQFVDNHYGFHRITMTSAALILAKMHNYVCSEISGLADYTIHKRRLEGYDIYCPVVLPLHEAKIQPKKMLEVVKRLENFPEAGRKPIFDHYIVLVPAMAQVAILRGELKPKPTPDYWQMIEKLEFIPLLMGEKDGKCYFICFYLES